jgi:hypothetical protein
MTLAKSLVINMSLQFFNYKIKAFQKIIWESQFAIFARLSNVN